MCKTAVILLLLLLFGFHNFLESGHGPLLHFNPDWILSVALGPIDAPCHPSFSDKRHLGLVYVVHALSVLKTCGSIGSCLPIFLLEGVSVAGPPYQMLNFVFLRLGQRLGLKLGHHALSRKSGPVQLLSTRYLDRVERVLTVERIG